MDVLARNQEAVFLVSRKRGNTVIGRKAEAYAADEGTVAAIEAGVPALVEAREIIAEFHLMIRRKAKARRASAHGSSAPAPVSSPPSPAASRRMAFAAGRSLMAG